MEVQVVLEVELEWSIESRAICWGPGAIRLRRKPCRRDALHAYNGFARGKGRPVVAGPCQSGLVSSHERHAQRTGEQALWGASCRGGPSRIGLGTTACCLGLSELESGLDLGQNLGYKMGLNMGPKVLGLESNNNKK